MAAGKYYDTGQNQEGFASSFYKGYDAAEKRKRDIAKGNLEAETVGLKRQELGIKSRAEIGKSNFDERKLRQQEIEEAGKNSRASRTSRLKVRDLNLGRDVGEEGYIDEKAFMNLDRPTAESYQFQAESAYNLLNTPPTQRQQVWDTEIAPKLGLVGSPESPRLDDTSLRNTLAINTQRFDESTSGGQNQGQPDTNPLQPDSRLNSLRNKYGLQ